MQIIHAEDLAWSHAQSSFQSSSAGAGFAAHVASEAQVPSELEAPEAWRSFVESHQKKGDNFRWSPFEAAPLLLGTSPES